MVIHTGGNWKSGKCFDSVVTDAEFVRDGDLANGHGNVEHYGGLLIAESIAAHNKPVIMAAPELLAALREIVPAYDDARAQQHGHEILMRARAAIAKAEGR